MLRVSSNCCASKRKRDGKSSWAWRRSKKLILFTHTSRFTTLHRLKTTYRNATPLTTNPLCGCCSQIDVISHFFCWLVFYKCRLCLQPTAIDQESRPASRLLGLGGWRGCRRQPRLLRRYWLGEAKSSRIGTSVQAQDCKSMGVNKWLWNPSAEPSCVVSWTALSLEHDLRLLVHFLPSSCLSCPENGGRRQQLWPGLHSGRAHPHANRRTSDPFHQPGGVHQFLLHLAWTAGGLWVSSLILLTRRTRPRTLPRARWQPKMTQVFQAVTFPNPVRHSACREVSHAQHTNQDCSARTPKHCCDSRNTVPERLLKTKWCFYCVLSWLLKDLFTRQLCSIFFSSLETCCTKVYNIRFFYEHLIFIRWMNLLPLSANEVAHFGAWGCRLCFILRSSAA